MGKEREVGRRGGGVISIRLTGVSGKSTQSDCRGEWR